MRHISMMVTNISFWTKHFMKPKSKESFVQNVSVTFLLQESHMTLIVLWLVASFFRSKQPEAKIVLQIWNKFTREHLCRSVCDFNKALMQFYWKNTSAYAANLQKTFLEKHLSETSSDFCNLKIIFFTQSEVICW